jgi:hypothetical protein
VVEVDSDSILEVVGGGGAIYGGDLENWTAEGVDLFSLGEVKKGDLLTGFATYSFTGEGGSTSARTFLTLRSVSR